MWRVPKCPPTRTGLARLSQEQGAVPGYHALRSYQHKLCQTSIPCTHRKTSGHALSPSKQWDSQWLSAELLFGTFDTFSYRPWVRATTVLPDRSLILKDWLCILFSRQALGFFYRYLNPVFSGHTKAEEMFSFVGMQNVHQTLKETLQRLIAEQIRGVLEWIDIFTWTRKDVCVPGEGWWVRWIANSLWHSVTRESKPHRWWFEYSTYDLWATEALISLQTLFTIRKSH